MKRKLSIVIWSILLLMLILDTETVQQGVREGIRLSYVTLIPALFPFLIVTSLLSSQLVGSQLSAFRWLERLLRIPKGSASIFILGLLGGYPLGAKCICQTVETGSVSYESGKRMLCFCSNAGPSFIFGVGIALFQNIWLCLLIWVIQLLSALAVGIMTPGTASESVGEINASSLSIPQVLKGALSSMAMICGWVIIFRIMQAFLDKWFLWIVPDMVRTAIYGMLELANGCAGLAYIEEERIRFIFFSSFLGFGGLCVGMQTQSITASVGLNIRRYLPAKLCQGIMCVILSAILYPGNITPLSFVWISLATVLCMCLLTRRKTSKKSAGIFRETGI